MSGSQSYGISVSRDIFPAEGEVETLRPGDVVRVWRSERVGGETFLGESRLAGWLQRLRVYEQQGEEYSAPYFVIGNAKHKATRDRDVRLPVVELLLAGADGAPAGDPDLSEVYRVWRRSRA